MKKLILIATVLILAGCASNKVFVQEGKSQQDFLRDKQQCMAQASQISSGAGEYGNPWLVKDLTIECLEMRGWRLQASR